MNLDQSNQFLCNDSAQSIYPFIILSMRDNDKEREGIISKKGDSSMVRRGEVELGIWN